MELSSWILFLGYVVLSITCILILGAMLRKQQNQFPDLYLDHDVKTDSEELNSAAKSIREMIQVMRSEIPQRAKLIQLKKVSDVLVQILKTFTTLSLFACVSCNSYMDDDYTRIEKPFAGYVREFVLEAQRHITEHRID